VNVNKQMVLALGGDIGRRQAVNLHPGNRVVLHRDACLISDVLDEFGICAVPRRDQVLPFGWGGRTFVFAALNSGVGSEAMIRFSSSPTWAGGGKARGPIVHASSPGRSRKYKEDDRESYADPL
jgi:hypothetical protein